MPDDAGPIRLAEAISILGTEIGSIDRTEQVPLPAADGRVLAGSVSSERAQPHYRRASRDGYAVRAADTADPPNTLSPTEGPVGAGEAARVHTGSAVPAGADSVVMIEEARETEAGVEIAEAAEAGQHVVPVGADLEAGRPLFERGHRLRPGDLGALKIAGMRSVAVLERPEVAVVPTGEELVQSDPGPGQAVETNGLVGSRQVRRWGGQPRYRDVVTDDETAIRAAIERDLDADLVVTTGGSSVGARDLLPRVIADRGEVLVDGMAIRPGGTAGLGVVEGTPIAMLPGTPVASLVLGWLLLRPALQRALGTPPASPPSVAAELEAPIESRGGRRTVHGIELESTEQGTPLARKADGHGLPSLSGIDGWLQVSEEAQSLGAGRSVTVEQWGTLPAQSEADWENSSRNEETR
ncbi:MAG: molybdopterin molybdotransferase MoeA [Halodesulfurarchaeum sp.]